MVAPPVSEHHPSDGRLIRIGYVPLIDCAPIVVAREKGFFKKHGLSVVTSQQPGWATIREKLVHAELDAAQCLGPLALAIHHGVGTIPKDMVVPLVLSANGNGITLSNSIPETIFDEEDGFTQYLEENHSKEKPLTLASVHPCSSHHSLLLLWLQKNKVLSHPFINVISLPPETMMRNLAHGHIGGFCVGEPWNSVAIKKGIGWCVSTSVELSNGHPEKVLTATQFFASQRPNDLRSLTIALLEACQFCQDHANRAKVLSFLSAEPGLQSIQESLPYSLSGRLPSGGLHGERMLPDFHIFHNEQVNAPNSLTASWLREGVRHSGLLRKGQELKKDSIFRMDLFEEAQSHL
ncbi:CmpA/NrtA family ABC transporter substrate-binding protein [Roseibacillus persicicus]|uniref:Nitrate transporter NrtC n=1 Tax=Roseibacillus persicicus TaxID=454148 RepID=A0A918TIX4_9BACT|nr:CmpA/NrtA family ABC transporter substrate-binding protein [Roseibacillus persicicus]GHC49747.1 nitrate transporter NrtC [Roseibacillus persicicus]